MCLKIINLALDQVLQLVDGIGWCLVLLYIDPLGTLVHDVSVVGGSSAVPCKNLFILSVKAAVNDA